MAITTTPSGGPQGEFSTYTPLYSQTISGTPSSITFSNVPTTYTDLVISMGGTFSADISAGVYFNGDTGSNYSTTRMWGNGTAAQSDRSSGSTQVSITTGTGNVISTYTVHVMNYSNATTYKTVLGRASQDSVSARVGVWRSTAPITTVTLVTNSGTFANGTVVTLYGIKAAVNMKATGGDIITTDGTYWYHAFTSTGAFTPNQSLTCSVLQVAGGGAGFYGGGGAGGVLYTASQAFASQTHIITVGAGGTPPDVNVGVIPVSGNNSTITSSGFTTLTAVGGGGGGVYPTLPAGATGANGGSGGGAGVTQGSIAYGGSPTSGQGNAGGNNPNSTNSAAGGGGAGAAGTNVTSGSSNGSDGGAGTNAYSSWLSATSLGSGGYIAGGGGGRGFSARGSGGVGGGGNGDRANITAGSAGAANTGGGGGGGYSFTPNGWAGGSGLIIVRYPV